MNTLEERGDNLVPLDYQSVLAKIENVLREQRLQLFKANREATFLAVNTDLIAKKVAEDSKGIKEPLGLNGRGVKAATVYFKDRDEFIGQIQKIDRLLRDILAAKIMTGISGETVEQYVARFVSPLKDLTGDTGALGLHYSFDKTYYGLTKQRLTLNPTTKPILRFHKLTITVKDVAGFRSQAEQDLKHYIKQKFRTQDEETLEELEGVLTSSSSDLSWLERLVDRESLGKIKKEAQIRYLEFLAQNLGDGDGARYLQDIIRRLRLVEEYLSDLSRSDGDFSVNYAGSASYNYRDLFARADVYNVLPIIPVIQGTLGETTNEEDGTRTFVFGIKMKFNGKVTNQEELTKPLPAFDYYLAQLDPTSTLHHHKLNEPFKNEWFKRRVLQLALSYFFVFNEFGNEEYDPIGPFNRFVMPILRGSNEDQKIMILQRIHKAVSKPEVHHGINTLAQWLRNSIEDKKSSFQNRSYPVHIVVKRGILKSVPSDILAEESFFKNVLGEKTKDALRYLSIGEAGVDPTAFCKLPAEITISNLHYSQSGAVQKFNMRYNIAGIDTLPVLNIANESLALYQQHFKNYSLLILPYTSGYLDRAGNESKAAFVYRFTFSLLSYLSLRFLQSVAERELFLPILRLHLGHKQQYAQPKSTEQGTFIRSFSKVLAHLLNEDGLANAQGLDVQNMKGLKYRLKNGLSSLYSVLPKQFEFTKGSPPFQLDKLAIVTVSSRQCDRSWGNGTMEKLSCLMGEAIGIERLASNKVQVQLIGTFSDHYHVKEMISSPTVLIDEVGNLYEQGYRHIIYVAKAPYTRTLHMTQEEEEDNLFFMSPKIIRELKANRPDLKLYPIFFESYSVVKIPTTFKGKKQSLFIEDVTELRQIVKDENKLKQAVMFFNLFNGISVGNNPDERYYNGVMSYSTLLGIYEDILDDLEIGKALFEEGALKSDILNYLTLFHFSRYEAATGGISLKLNPYKSLIGDDSVGKLAMWKHIGGQGEWNALAFLTEVRKVLAISQR